ncbi:MAG: 30S ribosomal protein S20 [Bacteroidota bacterium]|jgi:small subunit ribosomal protein S20
MPQHKSAVKRTRQSAHRAERNKAHLSKVKTLVKKVRSSKNKEEGAAALKTASKYLDQLGTKGVIHKNNASNQKSRLTKFVNKIK